MLNLFKKIIEWKLRVLAKWVLNRYQPKVIGLTGSVGKTSTKEAIYTVLSSEFRVWKNIKNYNNELGVPLSILGMESGFKNPIAWFGVFARGLWMVLFRKKDYPEYLVLEMGADKPGDIKYLVDLVPCNASVVTAIGPTHLELFGSLEKVVREKQHIVSHLKVDDFAILDADEELVMGMKEKTRAKVITYGFAEGATVQATELDISAGPSSDPWVDMQIKGVSFKLKYEGSFVPVFLHGVLGKHQVYAALAAAAVGVTYGMNLADISAALKNYKSPAGRMRLIRGIKHTSIIDDTYNSSPLAATAALNVLKEVKVSGMKFIALGDMLELGTYTEQGHREVGMVASEVADVLICVGERSKYTVDAAVEAGMSEDRVFRFVDTTEAGKFIQRRMKQGDILLVKGSQGSRMERVVKELMAEPLKAKELLVRQGKEWE